MTTPYKYHPIANLFPLLEEDAKEQKELAESIKTQGLLHTIVLFEGKILDGRNRQRACVAVGVEPRYEELPAGKDPFEYVAAMNIHRRHLDKSQRAIIAEKMARMKRGGDRKSDQSSDQSFDPTRQAAIKIMGIGRTLFESVRRTRKNGIPEVIDAMDKGLIKVDAAQRIAALPKEQQAVVLTEKMASRHIRQDKAKKSEPTKPQTHSNGRLSPEQIAEYEARINAPSTYPEDLPLPVHPKAHLTAHIQEAITDLKKHEPKIGQMSRRWCYQEVWCLTQRIQAYAPGYGHSADRVADMHPRWVDWARSVAGKVRAVEFLELDGPQDSPNDAPKKQRKFSELGLDKLLKEWQRLLKRGLRELHFATDQESRVLQVAEQTILTYFEERRTAHVRLTPSPTGEPHQTVNGSPSLNREH